MLFFYKIIIIIFVDALGTLDIDSITLRNTFINKCVFDL